MNLSYSHTVFLVNSFLLQRKSSKYHVGMDINNPHIVTLKILSEPSLSLFMILTGPFPTQPVDND